MKSHILPVFGRRLYICNGSTELDAEVGVLKQEKDKSIGAHTWQHIFISPSSITAHLPLFAHYTAPRTDPGNSLLTVKSHLPLPSPVSAPINQPKQRPTLVSSNEVSLRDHNYFSISQHSNAVSILLSLFRSPPCLVSRHLNRASQMPLFRATASGTHPASHAYRLRHLANGKAEQTAEHGIKEARFQA